MVCKIGGQLGTKVVISALGMLALYMRFNGTGIWGGETSFTWSQKKGYKFSKTKRIKAPTLWVHKTVIDIRKLHFIAYT